MYNLNKELTEIGFENPIICPISAYAAFLSKQLLCGEKMEEEELDELEFFACKFKNSEYDLSKYSSFEAIPDTNYLHKEKNLENLYA